MSARKSSPENCTNTARVQTVRSSSSIAARSLRPLPTTSSSGTKKGPIPEPANATVGCFEAAAKGGTIFLDEVGNLAPTGQKALLRTLEEHTLRRVGGTEQIKLDVRIIAATNSDISERTKSGCFREDLYFRLAEYVITCSAAPLKTGGYRLSRAALSDPGARNPLGDRQPTLPRGRLISSIPIRGREMSGNCAALCGERP